MNRKFWIALAVVASLAVALGIVVKHQNVEASGGYPRVPLVPLAAQPNGEDVRFATLMIPHCQHVIALGSLADDRFGNPQVRHLAEEMTRARSRELAEMLPWKSDWHEAGDQPSAAAGLTSPADVALEASTGSDFDRRFLLAMIDQHARALQLARTEIATGRYAPAIELANRIVAAQQLELDQMRSLLTKS